MTVHLFTMENLRHTYDGRVVLSIPHLSFEERKIHAITGPNGSGKTTLCSIMALLLQPTEGVISYRGTNPYEDGTTLDELRRRITMVHQNPFLFHGSVEKNVAYGLSIRKWPRSRWKPKVDDCLQLTGIEHLRRKSANRLSGGEVQRVAMARALAVDAEVLILDEFTANVDRNYVEIMESVIRDVFKRKHITVFLVTHDERQALRMADTSINLVDGQITKREVIDSDGGQKVS